MKQEGSLWVGLPFSTTALLNLTDLNPFRGAALTALWRALVAAFVTPTPADMCGSILSVLSVSSLTASPVDTQRDTIVNRHADKQQNNTLRTLRINKEEIINMMTRVRGSDIGLKSHRGRMVGAWSRLWENKEDRPDLTVSLNTLVTTLIGLCADWRMWIRRHERKLPSSVWNDCWVNFRRPLHILQVNFGHNSIKVTTRDLENWG